MDKLKAMQAFTTVVTHGSFSRAADQLHTPKATVSTLIQNLEQELGTKLLHRTTRRVKVTIDGAAFYERCQRILDDVRDAEEALSSRQTRPSGRLRVDLCTATASQLVIPRLAQFMVRYPEIQLELGCSDARINLIHDNSDCAIREGAIDNANNQLVIHPIGWVPFITCASPAYLARRGLPTQPEQLAAHECLGYFFAAEQGAKAWSFQSSRGVIEWAGPWALSVNDSNTYLNACLAGLGIAYLPLTIGYSALQEQRLLPLMLDWKQASLPIQLVCPTNRYISAKVNAFIEWVLHVLGNALTSLSTFYTSLVSSPPALPIQLTAAPALPLSAY